MYFIIRKPGNGKDDWTNSGVRKKASDAYDKANGMSLREAAAERRKHMKEWRFAKLAKQVGVDREGQKEQEERAAMRAIRRSMERRING